MGSSSKVTVGYWYGMGLHFGLCHGPVDELQQIKVGDREAWVGSVTDNATVDIYAENLFGGKKKEGGVVGSLDVLMGGASQTANSYLTSKIGTPMPAFKGILSAVMNAEKIAANNPYIKPWAFRVKRILEGWSGGAAWYPEKASITGVSTVSELNNEIGPSSAGWKYKVVENSDTADYSSPSLDDEDWSVGASPFASSSEHPFADDAGFPLTPGTHWPLNTTIWVRREFSLAGTSEITAKVFADNYTTIWVNGHEVLPRSGVLQNPNAVVFTHSVSIPSNVIRQGRNVIAIKSEDYGSYAYFALNVEMFSVTSCNQTDMNPAHIVYQCLTDGVWGMGYPTTSIDEASFTAAADALYGDGFGLSMLWNQQESIESFIRNVLDHIGGILYVDPGTGKFKLKLIRDDYDRSTLPIFGASNLISVSDYERQAWGETVNEITVVYTDPCVNKGTSVTVQDLANIQTQGAVIAQTRQYPGITNPTLAQRVAMRDLLVSSTPLSKIKLSATRAAWDLIPGDVFRLTWPEYGIDDVVYRVLEVNRGTLQNGEIAIEAVEDVFGMPESTYVSTQASGWTDPSSAPASATYRKLVEAPYWDIARSLSAADLAMLDPLSGYLETLAVRPSSDSISYEINSKVGSASYEARATGQFCPAAALTVALTKTTTSITFNGMVNADLVVTGGYAIIDDEYIGITAIDASAGTATITRGLLDTVPAAHSVGASIWFADGYQGVDATEYADGEQVDVKLLPRTGQGELDISLAPTDSLTMDQRHNRPYPPGKVLVNGSTYPEWIGGSDALALTWAHRDRLTQTAYFVEQSENSVGPEPGTTYTVRIYGESNDLINTETGISGTSFAYVTEEYWSYVQLLLNMNGTDGSSIFTDLTGKTVTAYGNAQVDTEFSKFGGASLLLDGVGDYLRQLQVVDEYQFGTGDFTIECWVRLASTSGNQAIFDFNECRPFRVIWNGSALLLQQSSSGTTVITSGALTWDSGTFYHVALVRSGTTITLYRDGVSLGVWTTSSSLDLASAAPLFIGCNRGDTWFLNGSIDDFRITKGVARYNGVFNPPGSELESGGTGYRLLNGRLRFELESVRDGLASYQKHNHEVRRTGYGFNYGMYYG